MSRKVKRVIHKYYEYIVTKVKLIYLQKTFTLEDVSLKYILKCIKESTDLIVIFSSCTRRGIKARYNYMKTLEGIKANKLFILDDFASDHRGSYYLGKNFSFSEERTTLELIKHISKEIGATRIICCGSSKGGYSALNFGLQIDGSYIIAGGPQFYLDSYLRASSNFECLNHILGEDTLEKSQFLDKYLEKRIENNADCKSQHIYLHYSDKEHTYEEHIKYLLETLNKKGYEISCDVADYTNHSEISYYFPDYLKRTINNIISR